MINTLKQVDIFYGLTPTQLELIANLGHEKTYAAGEMIFREGANSDELYIVLQGEVEITVSPGQAEAAAEHAAVTIARLRHGQSFGEIALVDSGLRSATVRSILKNTRLLCIPRDELMALCDTYPQLGYRLMYNLATDLAYKVRNTDLRLREDGLFRKPSRPGGG
jgi:CRP-like cAMP-binding protein